MRETTVGSIYSCACHFEGWADVPTLSGTIEFDVSSGKGVLLAMIDRLSHIDCRDHLFPNEAPVAEYWVHAQRYG